MRDKIESIVEGLDIYYPLEQSIINELHKLFIEEQIRMLEDIKLNMYVMATDANLYRVVDEEDVTELISQLKNQLK